MRKKILITALGAFLIASNAYGSGYRIPEQSTNSIGLAGAYVAHTMGADTAYFNPANMSWEKDAWQMEASLSYIYLPRIDYDDNITPLKDGKSDTEHFFMPLIHIVSKNYNNFRFGFSLAYPAGLTKRWDDPFPKGFSDEFTLRVIEANPTMSYKICDHFSVAAGLRVLYADGKIKSNMTNSYFSFLNNYGVTGINRNLEGDTWELGYNLAMTLRPTKKWSMAVTYRSKVDLGLEGDNAKLNVTGPLPTWANYNYRGHSEVSVPVPAILTLSTAYTFDRTTVELTWDRTYWTKYNTLDFEYRQDFDSLTSPFYAFDHPVDKDWRNCDAYRIGITHRCTDKFTAMLGFAIDSNPVPEKNLNFELPDSDAKLYSIGCRYELSDTLSLGGSYFYYDKESRDVTNSKGIDGEFDGAGAHVLNFGMNYTF